MQQLLPPDFLQELVTRNPGVICTWQDHGYITRAILTSPTAEPLSLEILQQIYLQVATESNWMIESTDWLWTEQGLLGRAVRLVQAS